MSEHCGYVIKVEHLRPHSNADRMQILTVFGNDTCVDLSVKVGDIGIYFPTDLQLSEEFCTANNLVRRKDETGKNIGGYMDPIKRNVTTIRLRGEKSDGLYLPISCLSYLKLNKNDIIVGMTISELNGHEICRKFIPIVKSAAPRKPGNRVRKKKAPIAPLFQEHADTEQLNYNLNAFRPGDLIEITLKMHGTSQRTGYLPTLQGYKRTLWDRICGREGKPIYDWGYVTGTRRTVLETYDGGFYGNNEFREAHAKQFEGKLHKGETVYYEVVGFTNDGTPIMSPGDNKKTNDKAFIKQYGAKTVFSYGCSPTGKQTALYCDANDNLLSIDEDVPKSDIYVYRMTMTNEDGDVVEYTPDFMRYRCEQMGVKPVIVFWKGYIPEQLPRIIDMNTLEEHIETAGEWIKDIAEEYFDGPDPVGKTHVREGVVVRIVNAPKFTAYKTKNFNFKVLEGIAKAEADAPDMEEAEEVLEDTDNA